MEHQWEVRLEGMQASRREWLAMKIGEEREIVGASLSEPHTSESLVGLSSYNYKWQKTNTKL